MTDAFLALPILLIFAGALFTAVFGRLYQKEAVTATGLGWLLSIAPLLSFITLLGYVPQLKAGTVFSLEAQWLPSLHLNAALYLDSLSAFFGLLVTFIGTLVVIYTGYYFKGKTGVWRFYFYILLFMGAMLGLLMAGDIVTLFIFWEGTSIVSFLLVAYSFDNETARQGAFKALFITAGGGIALLVGLLLLTHAVGDSRFIEILAQGDRIRNHVYYPVILILIALGAFTKSAQFPFHIWLPDAMSAPTPASSYLHSATMVKAGIYLMARLNPVMGYTETWFWMLTSFGAVTMLTGAILALKKTDLKAILAYSTICQLGILMMMIGQDMEISFKALIIGILAHALYKSSLFLVVGIIDHETGTRDIRRLGGLRRKMPVSFIICLLATLSMAGLPPLFGFLAKETLLATAVHPTLPEFAAWGLTLASVLTGALMLAISGRILVDVFLGPPRDRSISGHEAPAAMLIAPAIPAAGSLILGQIPGPKEEAALLAGAAGAAFGSDVKVSLALWTGLNIPLLLSVIAITAGAILFIFRESLIRHLDKISLTTSLNRMFDTLLRGIDALSAAALRLQSGTLRYYLITILTSTLILIAVFKGFRLSFELSELSRPGFNFSGELMILKILALFLIAGTSMACVRLTNDFFAILAFGASGLGVAVLMALEPAPDLALVQIVVDILLVVILSLSLSQLPKQKLESIQNLNVTGKTTGIIRDAIISSAFGIVVMIMTLAALLSRPRPGLLTSFFEENAKPVVGSYSVVGAILTDFRGMDTLIEIAVFSIAGIGIFTLMMDAFHRVGSTKETDTVNQSSGKNSLDTLGIGGSKASPLVRGMARIALPLCMSIAVCQLLFAYKQPGDGFTAGVIASIGIGFWYVVFGYQETLKRLAWLKPHVLIGWGLALASFSAVSSMVFNGIFFSPVDFGKLSGIPLPKGLHLSTSFLFESAIGISVLGSVSYMLNTLGHPERED